MNTPIALPAGLLWLSALCLCCCVMLAFALGWKLVRRKTPLSWVRPRFAVRWVPQDLWIGAYVGEPRPCRCRNVYLALVPTLVLRITLPCGVGEPEGDPEHDEYVRSVGAHRLKRRRDDYPSQEAWLEEMQLRSLRPGGIPRYHRKGELP